MWGLTVLAPAASSPVSAAELRARLRLNDAAEDSALAEFLAAAVERFELDAGRPVLTTSYRQSLARWPGDGVIILGRGGVTSVTAVSSFAADGSPVAINPGSWRADLVTPPARVYLASPPTAITTAGGVPVSPVGFVEFTAGWSDPATVAPLVRTALMLLAGHWYENREAFKDSQSEIRQLPHGWQAVIDKYRLGISGDWGQ